MRFNAAFIGIGFTSLNKAFIKSIDSIWVLIDFSILPDRKSFVILENFLGAIFEITDITPSPPKDNTGNTWSSFPLYICRLSLHSEAILATWDKFPLASFIATILSILDNSKQVSGEIFNPVLPGTLYKIIGKLVEDAIFL